MALDSALGIAVSCALSCCSLFWNTSPQASCVTLLCNEPLAIAGTRFAATVSERRAPDTRREVCGRG